MLNTPSTKNSALFIARLWAENAVLYNSYEAIGKPLESQRLFLCAIIFVLEYQVRIYAKELLDE